MSDMTQEEIESGLTPEEIAGLKESDGGSGHTLGDSLDGKTVAEEDDNDNGEGDGNVDKGAAKGKEGGEGDGSGAGEGDAAAAVDAAAAAAAGADDNPTGAADAGNGDAAGAGDDAAAPITNSAFDLPDPVLTAAMPENAEARLKAFDEQRAALAKQHDEGDITTVELLEKRDAIDAERRKLERDIDKAETAQDAYQNAVLDIWKRQVAEFTTRIHSEYKGSKARYLALDTYVRDVGQEAAFANATSRQILDEAHKRVVADLGEVAKPAPAKQDQKKGEIKNPATGKDLNLKGQPLKGSKPKAPETLRDVPAATGNDTDPQAGKFAALDRLQASDPEAHEEALMRLSPSERDAYLAYGG